MKWPFLVWSVLLCLIKYEMVSPSITDKSEMVGWIFGSNLEVMAISEHLRKPKKARINMASSVRAELRGW